MTFFAWPEERKDEFDRIFKKRPRVTKVKIGEHEFTIRIDDALPPDSFWLVSPEPEPRLSQTGDPLEHLRKLAANIRAVFVKGVKV